MIAADIPDTDPPVIKFIRAHDHIGGQLFVTGFRGDNALFAIGKLPDNASLLNMGLVEIKYRELESDLTKMFGAA